MGDWHPDGPALPVEFARQSGDGRMTLVIADGAKPLAVFWTQLKAKSPDEARRMLGAREGVPKTKVASSIGSWRPAEPPIDDVSRGIADWAGAAKFDGVVWTALPPKFDGKPVVPTENQVLAYLSSLDGDRRHLAEKYVRRAPAQIATAYRQRIERELGWTPLT